MQGRYPCFTSIPAHPACRTCPPRCRAGNALRLPGFFENLGHGNVINTVGGGSYGHIDSPAAGAISLRQSYECWKSGADLIEYAKTHKEFARAFESFPKDADQIYPGWRQKLGVHK